MAEKGHLTRKERAEAMLASIRIFLYNKETGEVMGRNAESWGKIGLFFLVYYACLAAFFAAMFAIAFSTMPDTKDGPKYSFNEDKPLLLVQPDGLGSWSKDNIDGSIRNRYRSILSAYNDTQCYLKRKCDAGGDLRPVEDEKQCGFDLNSLGPCGYGHASVFGYNNDAPCLYLRLSKIYGWEPKPSNKSNKYIELDCVAEDDDNTKIVYHPPKDKAFPISFWPFRGESSFRTPIAAIQVSGNKKEVLIKCKALAENIELSTTYKLKRGAHGQVEFNVAAAPPKP